MNVAELDRLLQGTSITTLTLSTPQSTITVRRTASLPLPPGEGRGEGGRPSKIELSAGSFTVTAPSSGAFRHRHPLRQKPLAQPGQPVPAGAVLGLLQVGPLLLHITAPRAGTVAAIADEAVVGYGAVLAHLAPEEEQ